MQKWQEASWALRLWLLFKDWLASTISIMSSRSKKPGQIVFSSLAFVLWVMVIGGTFTGILGFPAEFIGSILLVIYILFIPFVYKG